MLFSFCTLFSKAQKENTAIRKGNRLYKEQKIDESQKQYQKALQESPNNTAANYNMGNTQFRKKNFPEAAKSYDMASSQTDDINIKEQSLYNKGVSYIQQQKLAESISAWKEALKLNPTDEQARENLQKALMEQKKQQEQQKDNKKQNDQKKENKEQQKQDQNQKKEENQQQPQPQKSRLSKQKVDQYLKALEQKEKEVQDKMNQNKVRSLSQPDKDW